MFGNSDTVQISRHRHEQVGEGNLVTLLSSAFHQAPEWQRNLGSGNDVYILHVPSNQWNMDSCILAFEVVFRLEILLHSEQYEILGGKTGLES